MLQTSTRGHSVERRRPTVSKQPGQRFDKDPSRYIVSHLFIVWRQKLSIHKMYQKKSNCHWISSYLRFGFWTASKIHMCFQCPNCPPHRKFHQDPSIMCELSCSYTYGQTDRQTNGTDRNSIDGHSVEFTPVQHQSKPPTHWLSYLDHILDLDHSQYE